MMDSYPPVTYSDSFRLAHDIGQPENERNASRFPRCFWESPLFLPFASYRNRDAYNGAYVG